MANGNNRRHAVVLGGSMAGLAAARVLSEKFEQVTLVERDVYPELGAQRRGVPQGLHTHGLLAGGFYVLERLFPGFGAELEGDGAISADVGRDARWFQRGGLMRRPDTGLGGVVASRPFIESRVRRRVLSLYNVRVLDGCQVEGLLFDAVRSSVEGVVCSTGEMRADLVVDTAGRGSKLPQWLEAAGFTKPQEDRVEVGLTYTTRNFRRTGAEIGGDVGVIIPPTPEGKRGGVALAQEGGTWIVTLLGHFSEAAPAERDGFLDYARHLPGRDLYEAISGAEPIGEARVTKFPASVRRRFEKLDRFPEALLVMGDAICSFNPIYGQGMSVALLEAVALHEVLARNEPGLARRFFAKAAEIVDTPWSIAVGNDLRIPETTGERTAAVKFINWYVGKLLIASHQDDELATAFHRVGNLVAAPQSLMNPSNLWRTIRGNLFRSSSPVPTRGTQRLADIRSKSAS